MSAKGTIPTTNGGVPTDLSRAIMVFTLASLPTSLRKSKNETPLNQSWLFSTVTEPRSLGPVAGDKSCAVEVLA